MIDVVQHIEAIQREVGTGTIPAGEGRVVRLRRDYAASIDEVWNALTNPERIGRWFLPISGEYRIGQPVAMTVRHGCLHLFNGATGSRIK